MLIQTKRFTLDTQAGLYVRLGSFEAHIDAGYEPQWATLRGPGSLTVYMGRVCAVVSWSGAQAEPSTL